MEAKLKYGGGGPIQVIAGSNHSAGEVLAYAGLAAVVSGAAPIVAGEKMTLLTKGVFEVVKASGTTGSAKDTVEWNASTNLLVASSGTFSLGKLVAAAEDGETTALVNLNEFGDPDNVAS